MITERTFNDFARPSDVGASVMYVFDSGQGVYRAAKSSDLTPSGSNTVSNSVVSGDNGVALLENTSRNSFFIQNLSTGTPLYVKLGSGVSPTSFNFILKKDDGLHNGNGGLWQDGNWKGSVSCSGLSNVSYVAWEI